MLNLNHIKFKLSPSVDLDSDFITKKARVLDFRNGLFERLWFLKEFDSHANLDANKMAGFRALEI